MQLEFEQEIAQIGNLFSQYINDGEILTEEKGGIYFESPVSLLCRVSCSVLCLAAQSSPTLSDPMDCSLLGSSVHGDSPRKNTGVGYHALFQEIVPTQGSNPASPHCRQILYHLRHHGSPRILE